MKLRGTITALITPLKGNQLDEKGLIQNIQFQLSQGINGLVLLGSTGEAATLSNEEKAKILTICVKEIEGKVPIIVGTGTNCTKKTIDQTRQAQDLGADIALIVNPYYNKPTQEGIFQHYEAITRTINMPLIIYNVPNRTGSNIEVETVLRLSELPQVIGIKEASANVNQVGNILHAVVEKNTNFSVFSGDDSLTLPLMALGADGVISVISNLLPSIMGKLVEACLQKQFDQALEIHYSLLPLLNAFSLETNPIPIKTAMNLCGLPAGDLRLPLYEMNSRHREILHSVLTQRNA